MNRVTLIVFALLVFVSAYAVLSDIGSSAADSSEYSGKCGDQVTYEFNPSTGVLLINGSGLMYDYPFTPSAPWSSYSKNIRSVEITGSVTSIGGAAFRNCTSLISVTIPDSVETINTSAFCNCTSLTSITIPDSVKLIGDTAFSCCTSLTSISIPNSVTTLGYSVFYWCSELVSVTIGNSVYTINPGTFNYCTSLTTIIVDEKNTYYCSDNGVLFNKAMTELIQYPAAKIDATYTIPGSVRSIYNTAFQCCSKLTSVIISESVTTVGYSAFSHCTALTSVIIGNSVTEIQFSTFYGCSKLTSVTVGNSVTTLESSAFNDCSSLTFLTIPESVTSIEKDVFDGCISLTTITVDEKNQDYCSVDGVLFNKSMTELILYPAGKADTTYSIPDTVITISYSAFYDSSKLTSVTIPESVTMIRDSAFKGCTSLTSVTIPDSVTTLQYSVFDGCTSLASVTLGNSLSDIRSYVFRDCTSLTSLTFPSSLTFIGWYAFEGCTSLTTITVDEKNTDYCSVDGVLFNKAMTELIQYPADKTGATYVIPETVLSIRDIAVCGCSHLASVTIPGSVTNIGLNLIGCTSLTTITVDEKNPNYCSVDGVLFNKTMTELILYPAGKSDLTYSIPDSVTYIGSSAFYGCATLVSVTLPESVTTIEYSAFSNCTSLTTITVDEKNPNYCSVDGVLFDKAETTLIQYPAGKTDATYTTPESVTSIESYAFDGCTYLTSITLSEYVTSLGSYVFRGCTALTSVTLPNSVTGIGNYAFDGKFYDTDCETNLEPIAENLAGFTFKKIGDNWVKHVYSGNCGDDVKFVFDTTQGTLTIEGTGQMYDFTENSMPWNPYKDSIKIVNIADSITSIGSYAFYGCTSLTLFDVSAENKAYSSLDGVLFNKAQTILIQYPAGKMATSYTIPDSVTTIGDRAFYDISVLGSISIPGSVNSIGESAFNMVFYDADGQTVIEPTAQNLAGLTFKKIDDKWVKQIGPVEKNYRGNVLVCLVIAFFSAIIDILFIVKVKKRKV